ACAAGRRWLSAPEGLFDSSSCYPSSHGSRRDGCRHAGTYDYVYYSFWLRRMHLSKVRPLESSWPVLKNRAGLTPRTRVGLIFGWVTEWGFCVRLGAIT